MLRAKCGAAALILIYAAIAASAGIAADAFPTKPIKVVMPVPAGSGPDVQTRVIAEQLTRRWGQQVLVENRPGASGFLAAQAVAGAPPDGYTLLAGLPSIFTILPVQRDRLPIDVNRDLIHVGMMVGAIPLYIAVSPKIGVASLPELASLARSKPFEVAVGTNGVGTMPHFVALVLAKMGNIPITVVPYNQDGTLAAIADIMGGRVHATIDAAGALRGSVQSGDLKLIGAMSPDPFFPEVPTVAATVPGFSAVGFLSLAAPAGTPEHIVRRLNEGLGYALETPSVKQRFAELGTPIMIMTPEQTKAFVESEQKRWWPLVKENEPK
jgi:tripartite-type tricarboxylate transporter receptor subunit TctC